MRLALDPHLRDRTLLTYGDDFEKAYEIMLERCSTKWAPWHVIPADHKWVRKAVIARIVRATLEAMDPRYPQVAWKPGDFTIE